MPRRRSTSLGLPIAICALALLVAACGGGSGDKTTAQTATTTAAGRTTTVVTKPKPKPRVVAALPVPDASAPPKSIAVPVLTYHRVHKLRPNANAVETDLTVAPQRFFEEMSALKRAGHHSVTIEQVYNALYRGGSLPSKPVLITVDDGYVDDVRSILPILRNFNFTAAFYVITSRFKEPGFMTKAQVRELDRAGMDVGSHSFSHLDLTTMSDAQLQQEIVASKRTLEQVVGHPISSFCYPAGRFDDRVVGVVRRAGYALAFTTQYGTKLSSTTPLTEPRLHVGRTATSQSVLALAAS